MKTKFSKNERLIHHLMLKSVELKNPGLLDGKMGLSIFFFHYARFADNDVYEELAGDLIDELLENIHQDLPITFASGLSGIAWGVEYLIKNGFVEGKSNEICEELDKKIMTVDPRRLESSSLKTGLEGIAHYVLARMSGAIRQKAAIPFDEMYVRDLSDALKTALQKQDSLEMNKFLQQLLSFTKKEKPIEYTFDIFSMFEASDIREKRMYSLPLDLDKGIAGYLLNQIRLYTQDKAWILSNQIKQDND